MGAGLRVFDENGNVVLDTGTRMGTVLGTVQTGKSNGSVTHPAFALGQPFYSCMVFGSGTSVVGPKITVSGTTLRWDFRSSALASNGNFVIIYGVF